MKKIIAMILALVMVFALCACGSAPAKEESNKLILGTSADYAPFEFMYPDDKGELVYGGIDIFAAEYIAAAMGKELQIENMAFDYLLAALQKGDYDIVIAAMESTEERLNAADFSDPYFTDEPAKILVLADKADQYSDLASFAGLSVAAQTATTKELMVMDNMPDSNLVSLQNVNDIINQLVNGKIDAAIVDGGVALQHVELNSELAIAEEASAQLPPPAPYCVAVQKGDPKGLLPDINAAIAKMLEEGKIVEFKDKASSLGDVIQLVSVDAPEA